MKLYHRLLFCLWFFLYSVSTNAEYALGCEDPNYKRYIAERFVQISDKNKRLYNETNNNYQHSVANSNNPYRVISDLSRHLFYSAQFDQIEDVKSKIDKLFDYSEALRIDQQIAASAFDSFSRENHSVGIARAWIAYRQGDTKKAFTEMMLSLQINDSAVLSAFGPDLHFIRHIYADGHVKPVLDYLTKTEEFWNSKKAQNQRYIWRHMISKNCLVQFEFFDVTKALELGLSVRDVTKDYVR